MFNSRLVVDEDNVRIGTLLQRKFLMSRSLLRQLKTEPLVTWNGKPAYLTSKAMKGDVIEVELPRETSAVTAEPMNLDIRYEDEHVIVINKPPGILTHPSARVKTGSLLAGVRAHLAPSNQVPHSVHRLDKETSGVVMFAKHAYMHHLYDRVLQSGNLHRQYTAIVYLSPEASETLQLGEWTTINKPIAQDPDKPSRRIIDASGQESITHMQLTAKVGRAGLVRFRLETGRTHQIRLHMASIGLPLVGDRDYTYEYLGNKATVESTMFMRFLNHQALHAFRLDWINPLTKQEHMATAPIPEDMSDLWLDLGGASTDWDFITRDAFSN